MKKNSFFFIFYTVFLFFSTALRLHAEDLHGLELCNQFRTLLIKNDLHCTENYLIPSEGEKFPFNIKVDFKDNHNFDFDPKAEKRISEIYFVFSLEEAAKNHRLILKLIDNIKTTLTPECNVHFLFSYGDVISDFKESTISGTESFIENLDDTDNLAAFCISLNRARNAIIPGSAGEIAPSWLIQLAADSFHSNRLFYIIKGGFLSPFYRLNILANDYRTGLFLKAGIPAAGIELAASENSNTEYTRKLQNFFSTILTDFDSEKTLEWDRHSQVIQLGTFAVLVPEIFTVIGTMILGFLSLLILCEFSFFFHSSRKDFSLLVKKSWYLIPLCAVLTATAFYIGQAVAWILYKTLEPDPYFVFSVKVVTGISIISFCYLVLLKLKGNSFHHVYPYLMTITSVMNIFLFSAVDMSLFYLFASEYLLVYLSRLTKRTISLSIAFLILTLPFIPYGVQTVLYADPGTIPRITFCNLPENLIVSFAVLPFEFSWLRILSRLNIMWKRVEKKRRQFIKQNVIAIAASVGIFAVILITVSKVIPQKYKENSGIISRHYFETHNDDIILIEYSDSIYFENLNRVLHIHLNGETENVRVIIIGKTAQPLQYSEFPYTSDSKHMAYIVKLPLYPPEDIDIPFIANRNTDMIISVQTVQKSEENKNERTEIIKNIEIKKWNQESHETR